MLLASRAANTLLRLFPRSFVRDVGGFQVEGNTRDLIQRYLYMFGIWEPATTSWIERSLQPGDTFVDVGANIGYFSLLAARKVGLAGSVVSIEASPSIFESLQSHLVRNQAFNVRALNAAASSELGSLQVFRAPDDNLGATTTVDYGEPGYVLEAEVEAAPLHELLTPEEAANARIIKVDVEGAEWDVVQGLLPLLGGRPDLEVIVEMQGDELADGRIIRAFADAGFHCYSVVNDYAVSTYVARESARPIRLEGRLLLDQADLIFSRTDAALL